MAEPRHVMEFRVRYSDTDQMGTYYNSRPLEWFEQGRSELCRALGRPYREMESLGVRMPVTESHVEYLGPAEYDDLLRMTLSLSMAGRARLRFDVAVEQAATGRAVCRGWTVHAVTNLAGRPVRPPVWLCAMIVGRAANEDCPS
jgi:acyl-CoA thioester hydrolase